MLSVFFRDPRLGHDDIFCITFVPSYWWLIWTLSSLFFRRFMRYVYTGESFWYNTSMFVLFCIGVTRLYSWCDGCRKYFVVNLQLIASFGINYTKNKHVFVFNVILVYFVLFFCSSSLLTKTIYSERARCPNGVTLTPKKSYYTLGHTHCGHVPVEMFQYASENPMCSAANMHDGHASFPHTRHVVILTDGTLILHTLHTVRCIRRGSEIGTILEPAEYCGYGDPTT